MYHVSLNRLRWAVLASRSYDHLNVGFGQHHSLEPDHVWTDLFRVLT